MTIKFLIWRYIRPNEKGVCYWYDQGLEEHAGESWKMEVHRHITNPNCIEVIFYMSEQLFLSSSIFEEIEIVCGISNKNLLPKSFFAVNLSDKGVPILVLKNALNRKTDNELKNGDFLSCRQTCGKNLSCDTETVSIGNYRLQCCRRI